MREKILELIADVNENIMDYDGDDMIGDGIISSFDIVSILTAIDEGLGIEITAENIVPENFANVEAIIAMVEAAAGA